MIAEGKFAVFETDYSDKAPKALAIVKGLQLVVRDYAGEILNYIKHSMQLPKTGLPYSRPGGTVHIASAPGEAPAVDTGTLINSLAIQHDDFGLSAEIGVFGDPYYAGFLEKGTSRMEARPYIKPAAEHYELEFAAALASVIHFGGAP